MFKTTEYSETVHADQVYMPQWGEIISLSQLAARYNASLLKKQFIIALPLLSFSLIMALHIRLQRWHSALDKINLSIGLGLSWLAVAMVVVVTGVVLVRLLFGKGSIAVQETVVYAHGLLFMLCLAFNLQQNGHVRVDVFYHRFSERARAWVNALGAIVFLLPFSLFLVFVSLGFVERAWSIGETSADPGGLPFVYLLKTLIPLAGGLLALQGISQLLGSIAVILQPEDE